MNTITKTTFPFVMAAVWCMMFSTLQAGEPTARELDAAIKSGDFASYQALAAACLNQEAPAKPSETALQALLKDDGFRTFLAQRQLIANFGVEQVNALAKAGGKNQEFLSWLLQNTEAMEHYLLGTTPIGLAAREQNTYTLNPAALEIWKNIFNADPDSKDGLYLKLAIATAISPPGSINIGAGGAATPADPVVRYKYFKAAHQNKELFPSFDHLTVWEYSTIVCSGASDEDLTWARNMVNTFRPDLRINEKVVRSTSLVWRRAAPEQFYPAGYVNFKNILAGGGKCGPKSSWGVMVCQAFGIPAVGVGQPSHACVGYKSAYPMTQPQPGTAWKVDYGRAWHVSKTRGLAGPDFVAGVEDRADFAKFSRVEQLRWLASAIGSSEQAAAIRKVAHKIQKSPASVKAVKATAPKTIAAPTAGSTTPIKAVDGVIHVDAASFAETGGEVSWGGQQPYVKVHDSYGGGKQIYFEMQMKSQWADYILDVPASGTYEIVMKAAVVNIDQDLEVCSGGKVVATVPIPLNYGLWKETPPVELKLNKGVQTLRVQTSTTELKRGIALKSFKLKSKK